MTIVDQRWDLGLWIDLEVFWIELLIFEESDPMVAPPHDSFFVNCHTHTL
jgi:hypothetical protein